MPTPDMSDEELDRLFRSGAEAYPDEVSLSGWLHLQEQLDAADRQQLVQRQVRQRVALWFAAELVLLAFLALLWHTKPQWQPELAGTGVQTSATATAPQSGRKQDRKPPVAAKPRRPVAGRLYATSPGLSAATDNQARFSTPAAIDLTGTARASASGEARRAAKLPTLAGLLSTRSGNGNGLPTGAETMRAPEAAPASTTPASTISAPTTTSALTTSSVSTAATAGAAINPPVASAAAPAGPTPLETSAATVSAAPAQENGGVIPAPTPPISGAAAAATATAALLPPADSAATALPVAAPDSAQPKSQRPKPAYRVLVGVVGGPEATAVLPGPAPRVGGTMGVALEYRLTSRFRVRTGLVRSVKRYAARGSDYNPPPTYWTHRIPVNQVDANCRILEIPLDVRYDVTIRPGQTLYASAGVTSLLMRRERYRYLYEYNGQYIDKTWSIDQSGNAAFSLLQLGVGLERAVGSRWLVQAEPFVKIPLSGVGFGQIKLSSSGVMLGIKYGLFRPRTVVP
ncbi:hypothetical protein [Hymenobacter metallilatus]|uniref:Outer membrane protein beta-barrel domain-containing protein n=1 Tax=Hymenobacter metallilatus TaxID=2493666 RepID=A0A3R9N0G0_9BACT|nr:hypothetical protein [Hymenobacter metallilatus]RSK35335.1 hypothetical protein EI290_06450 [Hymenobacter metallilatus]